MKALFEAPSHETRIDHLRQRMSEAITLYSRERTMATGDRVWPKFIYLGAEEADCFNAAIENAHLRFADRNDVVTRKFMDVQVVYVRERSFFAVGE